MSESLMSLKILLPFRIFAEIRNVKQIIFVTSDGSYGFLPHRLDCVAALVPGIFTYETESGINYLAVDQGVLVKGGLQVIASVRNAIGGADPGKLRETVEKEFLDLDEQEKSIRESMMKMESLLIFSMEKLGRQ